MDLGGTKDGEKTEGCWAYVSLQFSTQLLLYIQDKDAFTQIILKENISPIILSCSL